MRQSPGIRRTILAAAVILTLGALAVYRWTIPSAASLIEDARKAMDARDYKNAMLLASESLKLRSESVDAMLIAKSARSAGAPDGAFEGPGVIAASGNASAAFLKNFVTAIAEHRFAARPDLEAIVA